MTKDNIVKCVTAFGIILFIIFILYSLMSGVFGFIPDQVLFIFIILLLYWGYEEWRLNIPAFAMIILGFSLHSAGVFGWYNVSPLPIQWDHITHIFGIISWTMVFFRYSEPWMTVNFFTSKNFRVFALIFFASLGVGALNETIEFWGYLTLGFGDGAFMFGPGDGINGLVGSDLMNVIGGGWINTGWDLTYNFIGFIMGILIMIIIKYFNLGVNK